MKPFSSGIKVAIWFLRLALTVFILVLFKEGVYSFNLGSLNFYISLLFSVSAILLFIGGFTSKPDLSVISGLSMLALSLLKIGLAFSGTLNFEIVSLLLIAAAGFYFLCYGN
jgi:hypothetical protein